MKGRRTVKSTGTAADCQELEALLLLFARTADRETLPSYTGFGPIGDPPDERAGRALVILIPAPFPSGKG
jgi:hypothetical protein